MDFNKLCTHCMREVEEGEFCSYCGTPVGQRKAVTHQLAPMSILAGKYLVGDVLGEGGFGITYIGIDINLEQIVAIKEFYPDGYCIRNSSETTDITIYSGPTEEIVKKWRDNFLREARILAKCSKLSGVVHVKDFFLENETAYIIMEYLEGANLGDYTEEQGGKIPASVLIPAIEPVLKALHEIHKQGLVHRDISPDNIRLLEDGSMKIMDFGAAKDLNNATEKSQAITLKQGYAPIEQYSQSSEIGPWMDVYAMSATIYKCLTGITPPEATDRIQNDTLKKPSELVEGISPEVEDALLMGLAVKAADRFQSMDALRCAIYGTAPDSQPVKTGMIPSQPMNPGAGNMAAVNTGVVNTGVINTGVVNMGGVNTGAVAPATPTPEESKKKKNLIIALASAAGAVVLIALIAVIAITSGNRKKDEITGLKVEMAGEVSQTSEADTGVSVQVEPSNPQAEAASEAEEENSGWERPSWMNYANEYNNIKQPRYRTHDYDHEDFRDLIVYAGNSLVAYRDKHGDETTLELDYEEGPDFKHGTCIVDEEKEVYENEDMLLVCSPCFYGTDAPGEYSGRLEVLMAKASWARYDYTPVYVHLDKNGNIDGKKISGVKVSSNVKNKGHNKVFDRNSGTCWVSKEVGNGEFMVINLDKYQPVSGILILNGDNSSQSAYMDMGRASNIEVDFGDGVWRSYSLETGVNWINKPQMVSAGELIETNYITVYVTSVQNGYSSDRVAISEVYVY